MDFDTFWTFPKVLYIKSLTCENFPLVRLLFKLVLKKNIFNKGLKNFIQLAIVYSDFSGVKSKIFEYLIPKRVLTRLQSCVRLSSYIQDILICTFDFR